MGADRPAGDEVLLLLSSAESATVLAHMLARGRRVAIGESEQALDGGYELGIVDGPTLQRFWRRIAERKRVEAPVLLPFLLVAGPEDVALFGRFLWTAVDELIQLPVQTPELLARVDVLLHAREASIRLRDHSEERFRQLFERDPVGRWVAAPDGRLLLCNAAFAEILGYPSVEDACGRAWGDLVADPVGGLRFLDRLARGERLGPEELELRRRDGATVAALHHAVGRWEADQLVELQGSVMDISERRQAERRARLSQRLEAVAKLADGVAHNLNNSLSAVLGYSDLLLADLSYGDPRREDVEEIRTAALRSAELTRQLLAFSRQQVLRPAPLSLSDLVQAMERTCRTLLEDPARLTLSLDPALAPVVADRGQLEQVLLNLVLNARDAIAGVPAAELRIVTEHVSLAEADRSHPDLEIPPGEYVVLRVLDTGRGMDSATRARLFEPFFTTKPAGEGLGLGLATAYGIVKQSGGFIVVESEPAQGAAVSVYLPPGRPPVRADDGRDRRAAIAPRGSETVLLVENEDSVRTMAGRILRQQGYSVLEAPSGGAALDTLRQYDGPLDLLVADLVMPEMSGRELADRVTQLRDGVRVLFLSDYADRAAVGAAPRDGVTQLRKPFRAGELLGTIRKLLDASSDAPALDGA